MKTRHDRDHRRSSLLQARFGLGILACVVSLALVSSGCSRDRIVDQLTPSSDNVEDASRTDRASPSDVPPRDTGLDTSSPEPSPDTSRPPPEDVNVSWDWGRPNADANDEPLELQTIVPPSGPVEGGNRVKIAGRGLHEEVEVFVGSHSMETELSGGHLIGRVPPGSGPGPVTVKAVVPSGERSALSDGYEYVGGLDVDRITPRRLPVDGGVQVVIRGRGFVAPTAVSFDGASARRIRRLDAETLHVVAPSGRPGPADVRITTPEQSRVFDEAVTYEQPLAIESVEPASGSTTGGQRVTIRATGFDSDVRVDIGGDRARRLSFDRGKGTIEVEAPPHAAGTVDVSLQSKGASTLREDAYYYRSDDTPEIASIRPSHGPTSGGTEVVLTGYGFGASNASIRFGDENATIVESEPTRAVVETPSVSSPGRVDVSLRHGSQTVATLTEGFDYRRAVWIDDVSPTSGPVDGGTKVTLEGRGFEGVERVLFGGLPAAHTLEPDGTITATTPTHAAGPVDVVVVRDDIRARRQDGFTYEAPLEIWGYSPVRGSVAGGTYVEVRGQGFAGEIEATLDGKASQEVRRLDRNNLYLYTPPHSEGDAPLVVEARGETARAPYPFEYFDPTSRHGGASGGSIEGAVNVTVFARGGQPLPNAFAMLSTRSDTPHSGTTNAQGQITFSGPNVYGPQTVTATAKGHASATIHEVDAENITLFLRKKDPNQSDGSGGGGGRPERPPHGVIEGDVTVPGKHRNPDGSVSIDMAMVRTTRENRLRRPSIDPGSEANVLGTGSYQLRSRIGDVAVVALCGDYDSSRETFEPKFIGVKRYLQVADGQTYQVDLSCDIPLDRTLDVKIANPIYAPDGPNINRAEVYWDFGFAGVFPSPTIGRGVGSIVEVPRQPALDDSLSDVTMTIVGGSFTGEGSPSSQTSLEGVDDLSGPVALPPLVDVPEPVRPRPGETMNHRDIRFQAAGPHYADFYSVYLLNEKGRRFWHHVMPGRKTTVTLPDIPDLSHLPDDKRPVPVPEGRAYVLMLGIDAGGTPFDQFSYRDLSLSKWRGYSTTRWSFRLPER